MNQGQIFDLAGRMARLLVEETRAGIYTSKAEAFSAAMEIPISNGERLIAIMSPRRVRVFLVTKFGAKKCVLERTHGIKPESLDILESMSGLESSLIAKAKYREYLAQGVI